MGEKSIREDLNKVVNVIYSKISNEEMKETREKLEEIRKLINEE